MTYKAKQEVIKTLLEKFGDEKGAQGSLVNEIIHVIENIPEEEQQNECCVVLNYEAMYHEAMEKLQKTKFVQESMRNEIQQLHFANARLAGFKEATELIFRKGSDCHGCP